jgi:hypothetical protein
MKATHEAGLKVAHTLTQNFAALVSGILMGLSEAMVFVQKPSICAKYSCCAEATCVKRLKSPPFSPVVSKRGRKLLHQRLARLREPSQIFERNLGAHCNLNAVSRAARCVG